MRKSIFSILLALLTLAMLSGVSALAESAQPQQDGTLGQVTQIDGNSITIALATMAGPGGQGGQASSGNQPSGDGQNPGNPPSDGSGQGNGQGGGQGFGLTLTGETLTFTVDDATIITLRGGRDAQDTTGSLADIQVDGVLMVTLNGSVATAISVMQMTADSGDATAAVY